MGRLVGVGVGGRERPAGRGRIRVEAPGFGAAELERAAGLGLRGAVINGVPDTTGGAPIFSADYEPVWSAAEATGLPLSLHIGHSRSLAALAAAAPQTAQAGPSHPLSPGGSPTG